MVNSYAQHEVEYYLKQHEKAIAIKFLCHNYGFGFRKALVFVDKIEAKMKRKEPFPWELFEIEK